jgi:hypothetical protein
MILNIKKAKCIMWLKKIKTELKSEFKASK